MTANAPPVPAPSAFTWRVARGGYAWKHVGGSGVSLEAPSAVLAQRDVTAGTDDIQPLEKNTTLFKTFSAVPCTSDGILGFADANGPLTAGQETENEWRLAIQRMRMATALWEASRGDDDDSVKAIARDPSSVDPSWLVAGQGLTIRATKAPSRRGTWNRDHPIEQTISIPPHVPQQQRAVLERVQTIKTRRDAEDVVAALVDEMLSTHLTLRRMAPRNRYAFQYQHADLLGAMWFQFAEFIHDRAEYVKCQYPPCSNYIDRRYDRRDKEFCSPSHKTLTFYLRHPEKHPTFKRQRPAPAAPRRRTTKR